MQSDVEAIIVEAYDPWEKLPLVRLELQRRRAIQRALVGPRFGTVAHRLVALVACLLLIGGVLFALAH